ncbi:glutamine amidotransferase-related protein [Chryseobacterium sp.]|uniref:glutamine amidotransferase-related protein n=1 Tax=Chryseobacterium sp. TaxID=1871047 RepID=UPI0028A1D7A8|nr:gamma-glutamyl-gamma-aminobutyrate hydrolase family protein [Chryseobacterium sp.]
MNIHFIQHESFEAPGAYLNWANERNYTSTFSKVYENNPLPESVDSIDVLIILGGPQDPSTTKNECPHFDAQAEIILIQKAVNSEKAVVGTCLGAQLIGESFGATFRNSPEKEIGVFPIQLTENGIKDDKINHFGEIISVGHWHNDMPGLNENAQVLAASKGCPRQIVKYSDLVYGFQCHLEFTPEVIDLMIETDREFLINNTEHQFVQKPDQIRSFDFKEMNEKLYTFMDKLVEAYQTTHH